MNDWLEPLGFLHDLEEQQDPLPKLNPWTAVGWSITRLKEKVDELGGASFLTHQEFEAQIKVEFKADTSALNDYIDSVRFGLMALKPKPMRLTDVLSS